MGIGMCKMRTETRCEMRNDTCETTEETCELRNEKNEKTDKWEMRKMSIGKRENRE